MRRLAVIACILSLPLAFLIAASDSSAQAGEIIRVNQNWTCSGPVDLDLVRVTGSFAGDAVNLRTNCTGRIGRLEVEGSFNDCIKVNPPAPAPHDLTIESGYCRSTSPAGGHFDGIQMGGGNNIVLKDFVMDWCCTGGGNIFIQSFNGGSPENFLCDHCAIGPRHANQVRTPFSASSGVKDSLVCEPSSGRAVFIPASGDKGGNTVVAANDVRCTFGGLMEYVQGSSPPPPPPPPTPEPPPPPPPPTEPPPPYSPACATTCDEQIVTLKSTLLSTEQALTEMQREVTALNAALENRDRQIIELNADIAVKNVEIARLNAVIDALLAVVDKAAAEQHTLAGR